MISWLTSAKSFSAHWCPWCDCISGLCLWVWPPRHPGVHCCFSAPFDTHTRTHGHTHNHWGKRHPLRLCTHTPRRVAVSAHHLAGSLSTSWSQNCWWTQYSFAITQLEKRPLQSAGKHSEPGSCLDHQPEASLSHRTRTCSKQPNVITCKSVTNEGSGSVGGRGKSQRLERVGTSKRILWEWINMWTLSNSLSLLLSLPGSVWAVNESESFPSTSVSREPDESSGASCSSAETLDCPFKIGSLYRIFFIHRLPYRSGCPVTHESMTPCII